MKKIVLIISVGLLALLLIVMIVSTAFGQGATAPVVHDANSYVNNFCFKEEGGISAKDMDVSDVVNKYTDETNKFFNKNIEYIMTHPAEEIPSISLDEYDINGGGLCKDASGAKVNDLACQAIALCNGSSTSYCVGITLLGFSPERYKNYDDAALKKYPQLKYSYFCYKAVLESKREAIYDGTPQAILDKCNSGSEFADQNICKLKAEIEQEKDASKKARLQSQMDVLLNKGAYWATSGTGALSSVTLSLADLSNKSVQRVKFIDDEIARSKQALDQTLDAYNQLKTAWSMHVKYIDIFAELVKYRDYLVAIRKKTDTFQFKFIDATTTKCL